MAVESNIVVEHHDLLYNMTLKQHQKGDFLNKPKSTKRITKRMIYRSVASSTAIETGVAVSDIERKLKSNSSKFDFLTLAD